MNSSIYHMINTTVTHFPKIRDFYELNVGYSELIKEKYDSYSGGKDNPEFLMIEVCQYSLSICRF